MSTHTIRESVRAVARGIIEAEVAELMGAGEIELQIPIR